MCIRDRVAALRPELDWHRNPAGEETRGNFSSPATVNKTVANIELDDLEVRLGGRVVLDGLRGSLQGRAIGLLGPNGSGKSSSIPCSAFIPLRAAPRACSATISGNIPTKFARWSDTC